PKLVALASAGKLSIIQRSAPLGDARTALRSPAEVYVRVMLPLAAVTFGVPAETAKLLIRGPALQVCAPPVPSAIAPVPVPANVSVPPPAVGEGDAEADAEGDGLGVAGGALGEALGVGDGPVGTNC